MSDIRPFVAQLPFVDSDNPPATADRIVQDWLKGSSACIVHYMYYASYVQLLYDEEILKNYLAADHILIDGIGMQLYCKIVTGHQPANLNGTDMSPVFFDLLAKNKVSVSLYGTTKENIEACAQKFKNTYGVNGLAYFQDGFSALDLANVPDRSALFIGMGSPRQERWVRDHLTQIREKQLIVFTVGGFFDFMSGFYIRAPRWVRKIRLEWAWRTMLHPGRHYQKRLRDLTILIRPFVHKLKGFKPYLKFRKF